MWIYWGRQKFNLNRISCNSSINKTCKSIAYTNKYSSTMFLCGKTINYKSAFKSYTKLASVIMIQSYSYENMNGINFIHIFPSSFKTKNKNLKKSDLMQYFQRSFSSLQNMHVFSFIKFFTKNKFVKLSQQNWERE